VVLPVVLLVVEGPPGAATLDKGPPLLRRLPLSVEGNAEPLRSRLGLRPPAAA